jgi:TRAP-type C4-dicarboxylate transport system substrate-binding protein
MKFGTKLSALALSGIMALATTVGAKAADPEFTFTIHHFLSPKATTQSKMIEPWVQRIEEASEGRIKFEIFPAMSMGGKPPELYRQVRDGSADIVWTVIGYTPGVFPRTEVFELPSVHVGSATQTNLAIQYSMDLIKEDFADVHPLLVHVHAGNALHLTNPLDLYGDASFEGLKFRTPSRTGAWLIEAMGAEPVGMPVPALPQALAKGTVDGAFIPFEIVPPLKVHELTTMSVEGRNKERFGTSVFLYAMNSDSYASLPDDLKKIVDDNSGRDFAKEMGEVWDAAEAPGKSLQYESGGEIIRLDEAATAKIAELGQGIVDRWVKEVEAKDIKGKSIVRWARSAMDKYTPE